jgi:hypothetical protein
MPSDGAWLGGAMMLGLALVIGVAGAVVLFVQLLKAPARRRERALVSLIWFAFVFVAAVALIERLSLSQQAAERQPILERVAALDRAALAPGSALGCLDAGAGDAVETACEKALFASPQSAAAAVTYMEARLKLLADGARAGPQVAAALARSRRAIELDRYGIAAQALAARADCSAEKCAAFALVGDAKALKANMKARTFQQYAALYAEGWSVPDAPAKPALSVAPAPPAAPPVPGKPLSSKYDFPSAASIPPVSIMNAEPKLPAAPAEAAAPKSAPKPGAPPAPAR